MQCAYTLRIPNCGIAIQTEDHKQEVAASATAWMWLAQSGSSSCRWGGKRVGKRKSSYGRIVRLTNGSQSLQLLVRMGNVAKQQEGSGDDDTESSRTLFLLNDRYCLLN